MNRSAIFLAICAMTLASLVAEGQTSHSVILYGFGASVDGNLTFADTITTDVDVDVDQTLDKLEMTAMIRYRAETPKWSFVADGMFLGLGDSNERAKLDLDVTILEADVGYRFNDRVEGFLGVRYTDMSAKATLDLPLQERTFDNGDEFLDPVVGVRVNAPLTARWSVQAQVDYAPGVDMESQWQAMAHLGFSPNERLTLWFGYRVLQQEFEDSGNGGGLGMDVRFSGPSVGLEVGF